MSFITRILIAVTCLSIFAPRAQAEVLASVGTSLMYELAASGRTYEPRQPWSVRGGYRFSLADVYVEYARSEASQGTGYVNVGDQREEALLWGRYIVKGWKLQPFAALAAGVVTDTVSTQFGSASDTAKGQFSAVGALSAGLLIQLADHVEASLEGRLESSSSFAPNPIFGGSLFLGMKF